MVLTVATLFLCPYVAAMAGESENEQTSPWQLEPIIVIDTAIKTNAGENEALAAPFDLLGPSNKESYTKKGVEIFGKQGNINVFKIVEMSPSINYTAADALGTNENGFHDSIRIRGKKQTGPGGVKLYDGMPISGNPGGGKTIFDMENIESVDLYKGYIPVDKGLGFSNLVGKVDMNIKRPDHEFGADLSQTVGSDNLYRSFLRLDTGDMGPISGFGSFSQTTSDKYKGEGDLERTNCALGGVCEPNDRIKAEFFVSHNREDHHNYYNLTYAETRNLGQNFDKDFNTNKASANYYDYNKQHFEDTTIVANIEAALSADSKISIKPYYLNDNGEYSYASGTNVIQWNIDHEVLGGVLKYERSFFKQLTAKLGYWTHRQQPPGPPSEQKKFTVGANGLTYAGWAVLADNDCHDFFSPFTEVNGQMGNFIYSVGVRHLTFKLGALRSYTNGTNAETSPDYDTAIATGTPDPWACVDAKYFREWLPSAYLGYNVNKDATFYVDYTRTYGLDVNLFPTYVQQRANFVSKGVSLQNLWDELDLEVADNFDLGVKYKIGDLCLNPNAFVSLVKNKQARIYDAPYNVTYPFNAADAMAYGSEIAVSGALSKTWDFLAALSYNKYYFTEDLRTASNTTTSSDGNQVPDAPKFMAKAALSYKIAGITLTPSVRYLSERYGDVLNNERVDASTIVDFDMSYALKKVLGAQSVELRLTATNLFNQKDISAINTADDALAATNTAATYQTGAPFGLYANVQFKF
ncbi:MAG: TonB-dependent receptor [Desulfobacterales bacterium]|jgi:iron complex outermembrane receptor protein|nr:TonB-dependent receptor [Desulfobacterales bacterium]